MVRFSEMAQKIFTKEQQKILAGLSVQAIYLFGSRAQGKEYSLSDYDYAVLLKTKGYSKGDETYLKLYDIFSEISPRTLKNDVIDIVFLREAGLELRFHVIRYGKVIYDAEAKMRLDFEAQTTLLYCDFKPLLLEQDQTILQSL